MKNKFWKKIASLTLAAVMASVALAGCGGKENKEDAASAEGKIYKIGVFQFTQHGALDEANQGFVDALKASGLNCEFDQQNASGDGSATLTIAQKMVDDKKDLIFAIATPSAQAVAGLTQDIPVVVTAVTDPSEADLVESNDAPGGNVTGTSDMNPVDKQVELLKKLVPDAKKVAVLYCSSEANSKLQAQMVAEACKKVGVEAVDYTVANSGEIQTVVESMVGKVDAIYTPTDNVVANAMATVAMIANENKIPTICGEENMVTVGGLATFSIDYYKLGQMAGDMAVKILKGEADPSEMPIGYLPDSELKLVTNQETANILGIDVSNLE